mmetsp:Transcript_55373/g.111145  ORF Transcript_55373/g.111145 Transcript_55373/m.111145 type:complete len:208 (+) Transcript_55373:180-803(+)|eukprot:CAMPEP_0171612090 /NCGR_PEP_ID=MMETSP0990-20121206/11004_1 /TAXON_ID=483369 /ORGANISM="non described non described, Strain CCMP2098" /LENGTH=207 /DNA_ID=CAMNT_0012175757 /DNA_START=102 /DNA_END=725 /DNA_ORIENTATION=+
MNSMIKVLLSLAAVAPSESFFQKPSFSIARARKAVEMEMSAGLFYSTTTGNTEYVAEYIAAKTGLTMLDIADAGDVTVHDTLIVGAPTWHTGADEQRSGTSWDDWLYDTLPGLDLKGKKVAIFGVGDQIGYSDNFCDATGELYDCFKKAGATIVGATSTDGYEHNDSKALKDGKFCGLMCDMDNQGDEAEGKVATWIDQLKSEGVAF